MSRTTKDDAAVSLCRQCLDETDEAELDDCLHCQSVDLCGGCMGSHDCDAIAQLSDQLTIVKETGVSPFSSFVNVKDWKFRISGVQKSRGHRR